MLASNGAEAKDFRKSWFCVILSPMSERQNNIDPDEIDKFDKLALDWWNPAGKLRTLHDINPTRLNYIDNTVSLGGKNVLDVGCGGGILTEAMARKGADVLGLDASEPVIQVAIQHARRNRLEIEYVVGTVEDFATENENRFDVITCMELLEHVPNPETLLAACARLLRRNGHLVLATINRNLKSWLTTIIGAEYLFGLLPKGTHDYSSFIRPSELNSWLRKANLHLLDIKGMRYIPGVKYCALTNDPGSNYMVHARLAG